MSASQILLPPLRSGFSNAAQSPERVSPTGLLPKASMPGALDPSFVFNQLLSSSTEIMSHRGTPTFPQLLHISEHFIPLTSRFTTFPTTMLYVSIVVQEGPSLRRALSVLDRTPAVETFKVGVIFVGAGQTSESEVRMRDPVQQ